MAEYWLLWATGRGTEVTISGVEGSEEEQWDAARLHFEGWTPAELQPVSSAEIMAKVTA